MPPTIYLRPVAYHRHDADRLLLKDERDAWYLWNGDEPGLVEIDHALAEWIYQRPEIFPMPGPAMWFDVESLPVSPDNRFRLHDQGA